jgi:hypothetical protein
VISEGGIKMVKNRVFIRKALVYGIIILLIGIAAQHGTATVQIEKNDVEKKDFLFQTIVDIANNEDFKNLLFEDKNNGFFLDFDNNMRKVYRNILYQNPDLLSLLFLTKNSLTQNKLEFAYEKGLELVNNIGEEKALELIESITITDPTISNGLSDILENNEEINNKIEEIRIMNQELNPSLPFDGNPIICGILLMLTFTFAIPMVSIFVIILTLSSRPLLGPIFLGLLGIASANLALFMTLVKTFC